MHPGLKEAIEFHKAIVIEGRKALVGYEREKLLTNVALFSEIPTTQSSEEDRRVSSGNLILKGVPGVGKSFFAVIIGAISNTRFARIQGRMDLQPTEVVGFERIDPVTGNLVTEFGPLSEAEIVLLDEINRIPPKSQSAFLEALQERTITIGKETRNLPRFNFAIATMNPVELGQGTVGLSEAATDRFAMLISIGYLPPEEEQKLVQFDFKKVELRPLLAKEKILELRALVSRETFLSHKLDKYIRRLVTASRPYDPENNQYEHSPSALVEEMVELGASPRTTICWGRLARAWAVLAAEREIVLPEDIQSLAPNVLGHRLWLTPDALSQGLTVEEVIADIMAKVPIP